MNSQAQYQFPTADTVLNVLVVGGITVATACLVLSQSVQAIVA